jgi:prevent-host-death family protein
MKAANVRAITELKNRTKELIQEVADGGEPVVITQNGQPKVVLVDVEQHDRMNDTLAMLKLIAQSQDSLARGDRTYSTAEVRRRARIALSQARRR